jgi:hypothetical protein
MEISPSNQSFSHKGAQMPYSLPISPTPTTSLPIKPYLIRTHAELAVKTNLDPNGHYRGHSQGMRARRKVGRAPKRLTNTYRLRNTLRKRETGWATNVIYGRAESSSFDYSPVSSPSLAKAESSS